MNPTRKPEPERPDRINHLQYAILLSPVRETMQEQALSKAEALEQLRLFIGSREIPPIVQESLDHLGSIEDESDFFWELGFECIRLINL